MAPKFSTQTRDHLIRLARLVPGVTFRRWTGKARLPHHPWRVELLIEYLRQQAGWIGTETPADIRRQESIAPIPQRYRQQLLFNSLRVGKILVKTIMPVGWRQGDPQLLYLHGGGYNLCSADTHRGITSTLALKSGMRVVVPEYRLAPEFPYPNAIEDSLGVYRFLLQDGAKPESLAVGGDSAGGGLSVALMLALRHAGDPLPAAAALLSPWVDLTCAAESIDRHAEKDYINRPVLETLATNYLQGHDPKLPLASPLFADLAGLPPLLIHAGDVETLTDDAVALTQKARAAGVEVELKLWPGGFHIFQVFAPLVPSAAQATQEIVDYLRAKLEP